MNQLITQQLMQSEAAERERALEPRLDLELRTAAVEGLDEASAVARGRASGSPRRHSWHLPSFGSLLAPARR